MGSRVTGNYITINDKFEIAFVYLFVYRLFPTNSKIFTLCTSY